MFPIMELWNPDTARVHPAVRKAIQLAMRDERPKFTSQSSMARAFGLKQQQVSKIIDTGELGPKIAHQCLLYFNVSAADLVRKYKTDADGPRVDVLAALGQHSPPVREVLENKPLLEGDEYFRETALQLELAYRARKSSGLEPTVEELTKLADQYDVINRLAGRR